MKYGYTMFAQVALPMTIVILHLWCVYGAVPVRQMCLNKQWSVLCLTFLIVFQSQYKHTHTQCSCSLRNANTRSETIFDVAGASLASRGYTMYNITYFPSRLIELYSALRCMCACV